MTRRTFRGESGRPFGTVAALICLIMTVALLVLWDVARKLTGTADPFHAIPALAQPYWGVLLAAEIVKCVTAGTIILAVWSLAGPIGPRTPGRMLAMIVGTVGAAMIGTAAHWYIEAAAFLGNGELSTKGTLVETLSAVGLACLGLWAGMTALEARAARSLPEWLQWLGLLLAAMLILAAFVPALVPAAAGLSLGWWGGIFATLYRPEDRIA